MDGKKDIISHVLKSRNQLGRFQDQLYRHQKKYDSSTHHDRVVKDFQSFYQPSDNIYSSSAQSGNNDRPSFSDLEMLANERTGIGKYFTKTFASKTTRNGFDFYDWNNNLIKKPEVFKSLFQAKFFTEQIHWVNYELIYGTSFLLKYWSDHDKYDTPPPKTPPRAYRAFPPTLMSPANISDTEMLWEDEEKWEFYGGKYKSFKIHPDRIEILNTRPNPYDWIGFSIFEPIYLSACGYMNLIVNSIKMVAKYGNVVTAFTMNVPNPSLEMYNEYKELVESMKANLTFILGKEEEIQFLDTKISNGLMEMAEVFKEDMAAGTGLPLNSVYGRSDGGGLSGAGALISKQTELETMSAYQEDLADNYWQMFDRYWDLDDVFVKFRLDDQKSDRARYEEEVLQWQVEMMKAQVETLKLQNLMTATQLQQQIDHPELMIPDSSGGAPNNSIGSGGNGAKKGNESKKSGMEKIKKANMDFLSKSMEIYQNFEPRIIDLEFRNKNGGKKS